MPSDLQITNIKDQANANNAITIASDGQITVNQNNPTITLGSNASGFAGIKMADQWRITATLTHANGAISSNLERVDDGWFAQIGTGMTESSGIFTFPQTGVYLVTSSAHYISNSGGQDYGGVHIQITENNADYANQAEKYCSVSNTSKYGSTHCVAQIDVDNTTNIKVKFVRAAASSSFATIGDTNSNQTTFTFVRLGDT